MNERRTEPEASRASSLAVELRVVLGKLKRRLREEAQVGDFTMSQMSVLGLLERDGPATVTSLARAEGVRPQSMGETISLLEARGLVSGEADPRDRRQVILSLTPSSRKIIKANRAAREDWLFRAIRTTLTLSEQQALAGCVPLLERLVGPQADTDTIRA